MMSAATLLAALHHAIGMDAAEIGGKPLPSVASVAELSGVSAAQQCLAEETEKILELLSGKIEKMAKANMDQDEEAERRSMGEQAVVEHHSAKEAENRSMGGQVVVEGHSAKAEVGMQGQVAKHSHASQSFQEEVANTNKTRHCNKATGETCGFLSGYSCSSSRGAAHCHKESGQCHCQENFCAIEGRCEYVGEASDRSAIQAGGSCKKDTGGSCKWESCDESRGPTECKKNKCLCFEGQGWCAREGACVYLGSIPDRETRYTGGSCSGGSCEAWRGRAKCTDDGKCKCHKEYFAVDGACVFKGDPA